MKPVMTSEVEVVVQEERSVEHCFIGASTCTAASAAGSFARGIYLHNVIIIIVSHSSPSSLESDVFRSCDDKLRCAVLYQLAELLQASCSAPICSVYDMRITQYTYYRLERSV